MVKTCGVDIIYDLYKSPVGELMLSAHGNSLCMCDWVESRAHQRNMRRIAESIGGVFVRGRNPIIVAARRWLDDYFSGKCPEADEIPLYLCGTEFQQRVWHELATINYGKTLSYKNLAHNINKPASVRAVAAAVGSNALSIFLPCHRVVGSDGSLTGYAGGAEAKRMLLNLEKTV